MYKNIGFIIIILFLIGCSTVNNLDFDSAIWFDPESSEYRENDITERQKMLNSVIDIIDGKSKSEIVNLLGDGLEVNYFLSSGRDLIYVLGPERSYLGIDYEWLLLWFDDNNLLLKYEIFTD